MSYTQDQLNEIWQKLDSDNHPPNATRVVDDEIEQVLTIYDGDRLVAVKRANEEELWVDVPTVGWSDEFK